MSADPIYDGVKDGFGIYTYCRNNPLKYTDPNGLYTVKKGDTLSKIATEHNTTVEIIMKMNKDITNKDVIKEGQYL